MQQCAECVKESLDRSNMFKNDESSSLKFTPYEAQSLAGDNTDLAIPRRRCLDLSLSASGIRSGRALISCAYGYDVIHDRRRQSRASASRSGSQTV